MRATDLRLGLFTVAAVLAAGSLVACKSAGRRDATATACAPPAPCAPPPASCEPPPCPLAQTSLVLPGDRLHGHLYPDQGCEFFSFDGVEYALLDFKLASDDGSLAAPRIEIAGPDGKKLDLSCMQPEGASVQSVEGLVLPKTGKYGVTICKSKCDPESFYKFSYDLRVATPAEQRVHLTSCSKERVSFTAPRGSRCLVTLRPKGKCGAEPKFLSVTDPLGGRALNSAAVIEGAPLPVVKHTEGGATTLDFNASQSGRYTVTFASEPGTEGDVTTVVQVFTPRPLARDLYHSNAPCNTPIALTR